MVPDLIADYNKDEDSTISIESFTDEKEKNIVCIGQPVVNKVVLNNLIS